MTPRRGGIVLVDGVVQEKGFHNRFMEWRTMSPNPQISSIVFLHHLR